MTSYLFISHSHADAQSASALVDYLLAALRIGPDQIRCTSVPGYQLPFGRTIAEQLKKDLDTSVVVVALLTTKSLQSPWVLFELGASWALDRIVVPILGPALSLTELPGPMGDYPAIQIEADDAASRLVDMTGQIAHVLNLDPQADGRTQTKLALFLKAFRAATVEEAPTEAPSAPASSMPAVIRAYDRMRRVLARLSRSPGAAGGDIAVDGIPLEENLISSYKEYLAVAEFVAEHPGDVAGAYESVWEHGGESRPYITEAQPFETVIGAFFRAYETASKNA
jgi:hypothetical protein